MVTNYFTKSPLIFSEVNSVFRIFQFNALLLLLGAIVTFLKQNFGAPIDCIYDGISPQEKSFVDSYCWKNYEPIVPRTTPISIPFAAVNKELQVFTSNMYYRRQSKYYRWIPLILSCQAILAYAPTWLWNAWKNRSVHETVQNIKEQRQPSRRKLLIINLANDLCTKAIQRRNAKPFFFCELLNILVNLLNVLFTDLLFQHSFVMYGVAEMGRKLKWEDTDPPTELFPTFAKCSVKIAKKEKGLMKEEAICTIPFNSLCEYIFMFLWLWFILLALVSLVGILYRIFMMLSRRKRKKMLMEAVDKSYEEKLSKICGKLSLYSWFTLYRISRNVDPLTFQDIISSLIARLDSLSNCGTGQSQKSKNVDTENSSRPSALTRSLSTVV